MIKKTSLLVICVFSTICIYSQALNISLFNTINLKSEIKTTSYCLVCSEDDAKNKILNFLRTNPSISAVVDMSKIADEDIVLLLSAVNEPMEEAAIYSFDTNLGTMSGMISYDYHATRGGTCVMQYFSIPRYALDNNAENVYSYDEKDLKTKTINFIRNSEDVAVGVDMNNIADKDIRITISNVIEPSKKTVIYSFDADFGRMSGMVAYSKDSKDETFTMEYYSIPTYPID